MNNSIKKVVKIYLSGSKHWVGDGFQVRNFFPSNDIDKQISPFLLLDYAGPTDFPPSNQPRGVGEHPHRGFETVTIVLQGKVQHRDSAGNHGTIGAGDVQWMTAASGVVHEEMHEKSFTQKGGTLEMVQLWVNLPKAYKMSTPRYQTLLDQEIPKINLPNEIGYVRVIAGEFQNKRGPANTFTPINLYDVLLKANSSLQLTLPETYNTGIFVLNGDIDLNQTHSATDANFVLFDPQGRDIFIAAKKDSHLLVLNGEPILEPIARQGPFVMNTEEELHQAASDYRSGKMGRLAPL